MQILFKDINKTILNKIYKYLYRYIELFTHRYGSHVCQTILVLGSDIIEREVKYLFPKFKLIIKFIYKYILINLIFDI